MPRAKATKTIEKTIKTKKPVETEAIENQEISQEPTTESSKFRIFSSKKIFIILLVLGILLLLYYKKSWFIAATVNSTPITNFELLSKMNKQFREQTLNQIINEKMILNEARKNNIVVRKSDIDQKIAELEKNVGGAQVLDNLLSQQGQTRDGLKDQLKIQITIEKLYEKDATVSAEEVTKFIEQNKDQLRATESAEQTKEATQALKQQKLGQIFNEKFQQLKKDTKVTIF